MFAGQIYLLLRKKLRPTLQVDRLCLVEGHCLVHAHFSPQQEFDFIFCE
jgi:hypothetical protein